MSILTIYCECNAEGKQTSIDYSFEDHGTNAIILVQVISDPDKITHHQQNIDIDAAEEIRFKIDCLNLSKQNGEGSLETN